MKIRNGFVSNSSSSSFIIGYGVVKDKEKVIAKLKEIDWVALDYKDDPYCNSLTFVDKDSMTDYIDTYGTIYDRNFRQIKTGKALIHAGNHITMEIPKKYQNKDLLVCSILNNEEDHAFIDHDNPDGDLRWDWAEKEDWYDESEQKVIDLFKNTDKLFEKAEYQIGAERNG